MSNNPKGPQDRVPAPQSDRLFRWALVSGVVGAVLLLALFLTGCSIPTTDVPAPTTPGKTTAAPVTVQPTKAAVPAADPNKATVAKVGAEFTVGSGSAFAGKYTVLKGWALTQSYGVPTLAGKVKNADGSKNALPNLQVKFVKGSELLMSFTCTANELEPGQTTKLNCFTSDDYVKGYTKITAETGL
jgi:hypothetical protein